MACWHILLSNLKPREGTFINAAAPDILVECWEISMKKAAYMDLPEVGSES